MSKTHTSRNMLESMPLQISTIYSGVWYNVGMRYLLLILTCASVCFAVDNPEVMKIYQEMKAKQAEVEAEAAIKICEYAKRTFIRVEVPVLPKDPKKSELERFDLATHHNRAIDEVERITKSPDLYGKMGHILEALRYAKPITPAMEQMGIKPAAQEPEKAVSLEVAPKAKEKKKITAVLADGTKIE